MTTMEEYNELAKEMKMALEAVRTVIPSDVMGKGPNLQLDGEAYQKLAATIFIEAHRKKNGSGEGNYSGPSSKDQQKFLGILAIEREGAEDVITGFLDANEKKSMEELDSSHASSLIDMLKPLRKKEKQRQGSAPRQ